MTEMIERVARAVLEADDGGNPDILWAATNAKPVHGGDCTKECHTCLMCLREHYETLARAAIEAMLEPSNAMTVDGAAAVCDFYSEAGPYPRTKAMWRAMIDAALKEEKKG